MGYDRMRMQEAAEELVAEIDRLLLRAESLAPRQADHLDRSADSVLFNMAEGIANYKPRMKTAVYGIARKEANEVRAVLRRLVIKKVFSERDIQKAQDLAGACVGMLTNAIKAIETRAVD
jgi:four helix bundle protein